MRQLALDSWLLTGILRLFAMYRASQQAEQQLQARGAYPDLETENHSPRDKAANGGGLVNSEDSELSDEEDQSSSDSDSGLGDGDGRQREDVRRPSARTHRSWSKLEEQRLLVYKKEDKPWEWILRKFPHRTPGAVRLRWHMLR